jgi:uncharacterized membrane protein YhaH (DUF805 family)
MLGFIFGFNARLGRLAYFLYSFALGIVVGVVIVAAAVIAYQNGMFKAHGFSPAAFSLRSLIPILVVGLFVVWSMICLMSMRIRDIGWNPHYVVPIYLLVVGVDAYVAMTMPALAFHRGRPGTVFGTALEFVFNLTLMFWPSGRYQSAPPDITERLAPRREPLASPTATERPARSVPSVHDVRPVRRSFGRLGQ